MWNEDGTHAVDSVTNLSRVADADVAPDDILAHRPRVAGPDGKRALVDVCARQPVPFKAAVAGANKGARGVYADGITAAV